MQDVKFQIRGPLREWDIRAQMFKPKAYSDSITDCLIIMPLIPVYMESRIPM